MYTSKLCFGLSPQMHTNNFSSEKIYSPTTHTFEKVPILEEAPPGFFSLQNPAKANLTLVLLAMISKVNFGFVRQDKSKFNLGFANQDKQG